MHTSHEVVTLMRKLRETDELVDALEAEMEHATEERLDEIIAEIEVATATAQEIIRICRS